MLLCGCPDDLDPKSMNSQQLGSNTLTSSPQMSACNNENIFSLNEQQQTSQLDRFTYFLLVKCNSIKQSNSTANDLLDILLNTLTRELSDPTSRDMARYLTARFVRSVIRLFIILSLQILSDKNSTTKRPTTSSSSSVSLTGPQLILHQCKRIFQSLTHISVQELVHMADSLISPVRHGIAKPTSMFNLLSTHTDVLQSLEEVFNIDSEYYRAYQRYPTTTMNNDLNEIGIDNTTINTNSELIEDDDNNSDSQSQHEIQIQTNNTTPNERQSTARENVAASLSDNESEIELELLAESDTDNESNPSARHTNTHRTSATAGSENMTLFSDDDNSESDDVDSVRSDSVLGEGDDTSQPEQMIFDDNRDALPVPTTTTTTSGTTTTTAERLVSVSSASHTSIGSNTQTVNSSTSHLNVPRLSNRAAITGT